MYRQKLAHLSLPSLCAATVNQKAGEEGQPALLATMISKDHKPDDPVETKRVESLGEWHDTHCPLCLCVYYP